MILALTILAAGLAVVLQGLSLGLRMRARSGESLRLSQIAENQLNRLLLSGETDAGTEAGEEGSYRWRTETDRLASPDGESPMALNRVRIIVEAPSGRSWEVVTAFPALEENP